MPSITPGNPYRLDLQLTHDTYPVLIGEDLLGGTAELIRAEARLTGNRAVVVSDSHVAPLYADVVLKSLADDGVDASLIVVPAGEASKSMPQVTDVCRGMLQAGLDRKSFLIALGGGVVGDLAGFAAAIFQRGIPYVQIPTTIVSQVDSSVGGKTGVNTTEGKNLVGAFHQPALVLADTATLGTLPDREFREGFAEIIKHAAIRDASLLDLIGDPQSIRQDLVDLIARNVAIKGRIVEEDEFETSGARALLNFGHTIGHGIEAAGGYGRFFHGEAISLGLIAATRLSVELAGLEPEAAQRITDSLDAYHLPTKLPDDLATDDILSVLARDKKFESGLIRFVLLRSLGDAFVSKDVTVSHLRAAIEALRR